MKGQSGYTSTTLTVKKTVQWEFPASQGKEEAKNSSVAKKKKATQSYNLKELASLTNLIISYLETERYDELMNKVRELASKSTLTKDINKAIASIICVEKFKVFEWAAAKGNVKALTFLVDKIPPKKATKMVYKDNHMVFSLFLSDLRTNYLMGNYDKQKAIDGFTIFIKIYEAGVLNIAQELAIKLKKCPALKDDFIETVKKLKAEKLINIDDQCLSEFVTKLNGEQSINPDQSNQTESKSTTSQQSINSDQPNRTELEPTNLQRMFCRIKKPLTKNLPYAAVGLLVPLGVRYLGFSATTVLCTTLTALACTHLALSKNKDSVNKAEGSVLNLNYHSIIEKLSQCYKKHTENYRPPVTANSIQLA